MSGHGHVQVQYFAAARELCGVSQETIALGTLALSGAELIQFLSQRHPRLAAHASRMRLAVNDELVALDVLIHAGDEVALLPPVAGGSAVLCELRSTPLSVDEAIAAVSHPGVGGIVLFLGIVRDNADDKAVARLDYEAHATLAHKEMTRILTALCNEHTGVRLSALHRVGQLAVGDTAVVVAASAAHRGQAFELCRLAIDRIKQSVPIWKKEWGPDGAAHWVNLEG
jgi:molybdopterin synthase catalytic subunit